MHVHVLVHMYISTLQTVQQVVHVRIHVHACTCRSLLLVRSYMNGRARQQHVELKVARPEGPCLCLVWISCHLGLNFQAGYSYGNAGTRSNKSRTQWAPEGTQLFLSNTRMPLAPVWPFSGLSTGGVRGMPMDIDVCLFLVGV